jgi:hypothetical protein
MHRHWVLSVVALALVACGPNVEASVDNEDIGERPAAGEMYGSCSSVSMCRPLEFCVFPRGHDGELEEGFCADACVAAGNASQCDPAPGVHASEACLDIGLADGREVCALDCGRGRQCPGGMRCEGLMTPAGERYICF